MDKELLTKWLAALRSGNYKQTKYALREIDKCDDTSHCCLGVLCEIVDPSRFDESGWYKFPDGSIHESVLSSTFARDLGLDVKVDKIDGTQATIAEVLMEMNDDQNMTFADIADFIEKELGVIDA